MSKIIWKDIPGYENYYQVSTNGLVRSVDRYVKNKTGGNSFKIGRPMKMFMTEFGYFRVRLCKYGIIKNYHVHKLVAITFIENINNKPIINHIDCNKKNNNVENLEWCTVKENNEHALKNNLILSGINCPNVKVDKRKSEHVTSLRNMGFSVKNIIEITGVTRTNVYRIINNKHYTNNN